MTSNPTNQAEGEAEVVIDMTSGVAPPRWILTAVELEDLEQLLNTLPPEDPTPLFDGLGYRGFVITVSVPRRIIRVQNGHVVIEDDKQKTNFADPDQRLEKWLLNVSKPHIEPQLYTFLEETIGG